MMFGKLGIFTVYTWGLRSYAPPRRLQVAHTLPLPHPAVQRGSSKHPGRCAGPHRRQPAPAQVARELPEPVHGPGAAAQGEHEPERNGQGEHMVAGPQPTTAHAGPRSLPRSSGGNPMGEWKYHRVMVIEPECGHHTLDTRTG